MWHEFLLLLFLDESSISSISNNFRISMPYVWHICRISYSQQQSVAKQPFDEKIVVFSFALFVMIKFEFFRKIITSNLFNRKYASLEKNYNIILTLYIKWVLLMSSNITNIRNRSRHKRSQKNLVSFSHRQSDSCVDVEHLFDLRPIVSR